MILQVTGESKQLLIYGDIQRWLIRAVGAGNAIVAWHGITAS
jgi:hypothetical protein